MALTTEVPARPQAVEPDQRTKWMVHPVVLFLAIGVVLLALGWGFLQDPTRSAQTRDPAWYTWRSGIVTQGDPAKIVGKWGPFSMFSGGYRVSVPVAGGILQGVAGIDRYSFSAFMMLGIPILTALAMAAFAYRAKPDPLLYLLTFFSAAALFLSTPYIGYLDDITILFILSVLLAFLGRARTSWGARAAVFLLGLVGSFTHPTTCAIFGITLLIVFFFHFITSHFSMGEAFKRDGPGMLATGLGMITGLALWPVGIWGAPGSLTDAALPPPYDRAFFMNRLAEWVRSMHPTITFPLIGLGIVWAVYRSRRDRQPADAHSTLSAWWLLPLLGTFGWAFNKAYPYYRFMNATAAVMALLGLGTWVVARWFLSAKGSLRPFGVGGVVAIFGLLGWLFLSGLHTSHWNDPTNQWADQPTRISLAGADGVIGQEPGRPIVFIENYRDTSTAYGWAKTYTNVARAGLPGSDIGRSFAYFGDLTDFLADRPTTATNPDYNKMSNGFYNEMHRGLARYRQTPIVFLIRYFNQGTDNEKALDAGVSYLTPIGKDIAVVKGPGLATPSPAAVAAGRSAEQQMTAAIANHAGLLGDPLHLLRVILGLAVLIVVPGLIAASWFDIEGFPERLALVPGISFAMVILSGIFVIAVTRNAFSTTDAVISVAIAVAAATGLRLGKTSLDRALARVSDFFDAMFGIFRNKSFAALMGSQFTAQSADGIVQGALFKAIAFGGAAGFNLTAAPSARYLLGAVLLLYLPYTFVSPVVGVTIDRFDRRRLLVWSNLFRAAVVVLVALAGFSRVGNVTLIAVLLIALACTRMLLAIKSAGLPTILSPKDLLQGNGLSQAGGAIFQVLGAGLAVVATKSAPAGVVAIFGSILYVVAALAARRIDHLEAERRQARVTDEIRRMFHDIAAGLKEVAGSPGATLGLGGFQMLRFQVFGFVGLVGALIARNILGSGASKTAVYVAGGTAAVGAAIGMVAAQKLKGKVRPTTLLFTAMVITGVGVIAFGGITSMLGFASLAFVTALGFFLGKIAADTIVQSSMPDDFRGRAFSLFDIAYNLGWIVPAIILFLVYSPGNVRLIMAASGVFFLGVTALMWTWSRKAVDVLRLPASEPVAIKVDDPNEPNGATTR